MNPMTGQAPASVKTRPVIKQTAEIQTMKMIKPFGLSERFGVNIAENS